MTSKTYWTVYRVSSSGPDQLIGWNCSQAIADYFKTYHPADYRVAQQKGWQW